MKNFSLVWSALMRRKTRTVFTLLSVVAAFLLFGMLDSVRTVFADAGHTVNGASQLITTSNMGMAMGLPLSLRSQIAAIPGVSAVTYVNFFGGTYQGPRNPVACEAVSKNFFSVHRSAVLPPAQLRAFENTRAGLVAGETIVKRFGWKLGQQIPLQSEIWPRKGGSRTWTFTLVGIFRATSTKHAKIENAMFFRWKYFDEARAYDNGTVGWYQEKIANPGDAGHIAQAIDAISANSGHETRTETANTFAASYLRQIANVGMIVGGVMAAVFFTLILLTGNTMSQAVRERIPELAVLKVIGFSDRHVLGLVLGETVLLVAVGGIAGMLLSTAVVGAVKAKLGALVPMASVDSSIWIPAIVLMVVIGLIVGALPALRGMRLRIVDALAVH